MRTRKPTASELTEQLRRAESERSILNTALRCAVLDDAERTETATDDGWRYRLMAYRMTAAHGGLVIMRSTCLTNKQADSVQAYYLDDMARAFTYEYQPNLCRAIERLNVERSIALDRAVTERRHECQHPARSC